MNWRYVKGWDELRVCGRRGRVGGTRRSGMSWGYVEEWEKLGVRGGVGRVGGT